MSNVSSRRFHVEHYLVGLTLVTLVASFGLLTRDVIAPTNLVMLFLLVVVIVALRWGLGPAIFTAVVSVLAFDFFIVPPHLTFAVADTQYLLTFLGLLITGVTISSLAHARPSSAQRRPSNGHTCSNRRERPSCCARPRNYRARCSTLSPMTCERRWHPSPARSAACATPTCVWMMPPAANSSPILPRRPNG